MDDVPAELVSAPYQVVPGASVGTALVHDCAKGIGYLVYAPCAAQPHPGPPCQLER